MLLTSLFIFLIAVKWVKSFNHHETSTKNRRAASVSHHIPYLQILTDQWSSYQLCIILQQKDTNWILFIYLVAFGIGKSLSPILRYASQQKNPSEMLFNSLKQSIIWIFFPGTREETDYYIQLKIQRLLTRMKISSLESCQDNWAYIPAPMKNAKWSLKTWFYGLIFIFYLKNSICPSIIPVIMLGNWISLNSEYHRWGKHHCFLILLFVLEDFCLGTD